MTEDKKPVPWITPALPGRELLTAIGDLVVRHVQLDHMLKMTIKSLLGITVDEALQQLTYKGGMRLRKQVKKVARQRLGDGVETEKLGKLLDRCRELSERRNHYAKSVYVEHENGPHAGEIALLDTVDRGYRPLPSVTAVKAVADEIDSLVRELDYERREGWLFEAIEDRRQRDGE